MTAKNTQYFTYDGVDSRTHGIYIKSAIKIGGAQPNVDKISVPGRSGDLLRYEGSFSNVGFSAECFVTGENVQDKVAAISQWLMGTDGYRTLRFPWEDGFRMAYVANAPGVECLSNSIRAFALEFGCMPQVYTDAGQERFEITSGTVLQNAWMEARPIIRVYGSGSGFLSVGGTIVSIKGLTPTPPLILDCETQNAYKISGLGGATVNWNANIQALEFPTLPHGDTTISWTGDITKVEITPRWWHL